mgnify:CR=1 FL=1
MSRMICAATAALGVALAAPAAAEEFKWAVTTDPQTMECVYEDAYILIHEKKITNIDDLKRKICGTSAGSSASSR